MIAISITAFSWT